jgi:hypothetical protein
MRILRPICLVGLTFFALLTRAAEDDLQRVRFREVDTLFANPGQGWMSQQRSPNRVTRFPCSVAYIRFDWTDVEPQEGQYNWKFIDDVISAWNPGVKFLDIGSYGIWGEQHSTHPAPVAVPKQIVDMHLQAFQKTPLVFMSDDVEVMGFPPLQQQPSGGIGRSSALSADRYL